jgi:hypothetical protein
MRTLAIFITSILITSSVSTQAQGTTAVVGTGIASGVVFDQLGDQVEKAIRQARDSGDYLLFALGIEMRQTLERWREVNKDLLKTAFAELRPTVRAPLDAMQKALSDLDTLGDRSFDQIELIQNRFDELLSTSPLFKNHPRISSIRPLILETNSFDGVSRLEVRGANISRGRPEMRLLGSTLLPLAPTVVALPPSTGRVNFVIPKLPEAILEPYKGKFIDVEVTLFKQRGFFDSLFNLFRDAPLKFTMPVFIPPSQIGSFIMTSDYTVQKEVPTPQTGHYSIIGQKCETFEIGPQTRGGYLANITQTDQYTDHGNVRLLRSGPEGFAYELCVNRFLRGFKWVSGEAKVWVSWNEVNQSTEAVRQKVEGPVMWGTEQAIQVQGDRFNLEFKDFKGHTYAITESRRTPFLEVIYNSLNKTLTLRQPLLK